MAELMVPDTGAGVRCYFVASVKWVGSWAFDATFDIFWKKREIRHRGSGGLKCQGLSVNQGSGT